MADSLEQGADQVEVWLATGHTDMRKGFASLALVAVLVPANVPIVIGLDDTIERRWGAKIAARGIYRDPVRSSKAFFVKTSGLRWVCLSCSWLSPSLS